MAVREIRIYPDPVLRTVCAPIETIDEGTRALVTDLLDTTQLPGRAGVAAPQIGVGVRAFSYNVDGQIGYLINPAVTEVRGDPRLIDEGCLSVPGLWHQTMRYPWARCEGIDLDGNPVVLEGEGVLAQAFQHECDHLDGILYINRLDPERKKVAMREIRESDWF